MLRLQLIAENGLKVKFLPSSSIHTNSILHQCAPSEWRTLPRMAGACMSLAVRAAEIDYCKEEPIPYFDCSFSDAIPSLPSNCATVLRIFGREAATNRTAILRVHGLFPSMLIPIDDLVHLASPAEKIVNDVASAVDSGIRTSTSGRCQ